MGIAPKTHCKKGHLLAETRRKSTGKRTYCAACKKEYAEELNRTKPPHNQAYKWRFHIRKKYGMTEHEYHDLYKKQKGLCAVCSKELQAIGGKTHIDHCHKSLTVRGLLCSQCNMGLGMFKDDIENFKKAIKYLRKHSK